MKKIGIEEFLMVRPGQVVFDVRTPAEYTAGHIPGAVNLPLFSDEERAVVGTLYKRQSPESALHKGLEFAGAKMSWYVKEAKRLAPDRKVAIHCWRGGQRSGSMGWLLAFAGFDVSVLEGGYKSYRQYVLKAFSERKSKFVILGGPTGSGKTEILHQLQHAGEQVLDLEGLANHKGSSFGALGEAPQPPVEQFENDLFSAFSSLDVHRRIWVENESRAIGRVFLPDGLWQQFQYSPLVLLDLPFSARVRYLVENYGKYPVSDLQEAFHRIERRLGGQHYKAALEALEQKDFAAAAEIALCYYDKTYSFSTGKGHFDPVLRFQPVGENHNQIAQQLITLADEHGI